MGKLNLLQAHWSGKVGKTVGQAYHGKKVVRATERVVRHPNETQTKSVRAFEGLNRFASAAVKDLWQYESLSEAKMYKHNAQAAAWKTLISGHRFTPWRLPDIYPDTLTGFQPAIAVVETVNTFDVVFNIADYNKNALAVFCYVMDRAGVILWHGTPKVGETALKLSTQYYSENDWIYCAVIGVYLQDIDGHKKGEIICESGSPVYFGGTVFIVSGEKWLLDKLATVATVSVSDKTLKISGITANIDAGGKASLTYP